MNLLYFTIIIPIISFLFLSFSQGRWSENISSIFGMVSIFFSMLVTILVTMDFFFQENICVKIFEQSIWHWMNVDQLNINVHLGVDGISLTMLSVVTGVGLLIHIFSSWYMSGEKGYSRFFSYTNLFIASMIVLVLSNNLLMMYLGWECVGLCSYLLIGFYYKESDNTRAAMKAFLMTRIGDVFLVFALFILYTKLGTLNIRELIVLASQKIIVGDTVITCVTIIFLVGAIGKSAQLPLHTWLSSAMVGPTPVSALIHAATMVTAGVYFISRMHVLFLRAPEILHIIGIVGSVTLLLSGFSAIVQTDIKRVLAYSTMSQIGYMFVALCVRAWDAAIFHLMTHAFFKALLFLASGSVILACKEQNIFHMGGLRKSIPFLYVCFLIGGAALSALPIFLSGFFSKEEIMAGAIANSHSTLILLGLIGTFITSLYTFRMIFLIFHGKKKLKIHIGKGINHHLPLIVLLVLSTIGAIITLPLKGVVPNTIALTPSSMYQIKIFSSIMALLGILLSYILWIINGTMEKKMISLFFFHEFFFDFIYNKLFIKYYLFLVCILQNDPLKYFMNFPIRLFPCVNKLFTFLENGKIRWYIFSMSIGTVIVLIILNNHYVSSVIL